MINRTMTVSLQSFFRRRNSRRKLIYFHDYCYSFVRLILFLASPLRPKIAKRMCATATAIFQSRFFIFRSFSAILLRFTSVHCDSLFGVNVERTYRRNTTYTLWHMHRTIIFQFFLCRDFSSINV